MADQTVNWITVARILRPQGRKGEVLADLLTDFPESLATGRDLFLSPGEGSDAAPVPVRVTRQWLPHGRNQGRIVLQLENVASISDAERIAGHEIVVAAGERLPLSDGSVYISDLLGLRLISGGSDLGVVDDVSFPLSPDGRRRLSDAAPLLVVRTPPGGELLVPFVEAFLVRIDSTAGVIEMNLPEGLADLGTDAAPDTEHH